MARNHTGQMALYEAVNHERFKAAQDKELERIASKDAPAVEQAAPVQVQPSSRAVAVPKKTEWPMRPPSLQVHDGKLEVFIPVGAAIAAGFGILVLLLAAFTIGKAYGRASAKDVVAAAGMKEKEVVAKSAEVAKRMVQITTAPDPKPVIQQPVTISAEKQGDYVVVIKQLSDKRNLEPVLAHFERFGIATEIKSSGGSYFLVTKDRFDSNRKGSEIYSMLEKIKQAGAKYKAPAGYGNFGPKMFNDAYVKKM